MGAVTRVQTEKEKKHNNIRSIIMLPPVKTVFWSESGEKSAQIKHRLQAKTALNKYVAGFWCERQQKMDFSLEEVLLIIDSYLSNGLKLKTSWWICFSFCLLQMLTDGLEWCGLLVYYCDVFISCLNSNSDGTHSLQSIHCWDTDAVTHFYKSDEETNSSTNWMTWG